MIQQRNIAVCIILSLVTCGIYGIYWFFCLHDDTNKVSNEPNPMSSGVAFLLCLVTCGIYGIYWAYKQGEKLDRAAELNGRQKNDRAIIYLILSIFGLGIVAYAMMQDELNNYGVAPVGAYPQQPQYQQPYQPQDGYQQPQYQQPYQPQDGYQQPQYQQPYQPQDGYQQPQYQQPYQPQDAYQQPQYQQPYQPQDGYQQPQYQQPYQVPVEPQPEVQPESQPVEEPVDTAENTQDPNA